MNAYTLLANDFIYQQDARKTKQLTEGKILDIVKLRRGSGKDWQGMAPKAKGLKA